MTGRGRGGPDPRTVRVYGSHDRGSYTPVPALRRGMRRRSVLARIAGGASLGLAGLAGCLSTGSGGGSGELSEHPASRNLDGQPYLGDLPNEAAKLAVAFEDPTCSTCRRFHSSTFQDLEREIIEPESASFVYRPFPSTSVAWSGPAMHAILEATARDRRVAWDLVDFYYANGGSISGSSFAQQTRSFLADGTDLDADAVLAAVENEARQSIIDTAESDGWEAGVTSTPTFYLFDDGAFKNKLVGVQDLTAFRAGFEV